MSEPTGSPGISALLEHGDWLRRLALHLVRGDDGADDAVQETWIAALRAGPSQERDPRAWLARVLRNSLHRRRRTEGRRRAREEAVMALAPSAVEPGAAALERLELQRQLIELVAALDEPFRTTMVMRYFEGKTAAEIARGLGVPEGTIRWRTKEGLERLRARLDERHQGDRRAWSVLLLPVAHELSRTARRGLLVVAVMAGVAGLAAVIAGAIAVTSSSPTAEGGRASRQTVAPRFPLLAASGAPAASSADATIDGVVLGPDGKPVPGAVITARPPNVAGPGRISFGGAAGSPLPAAVAFSDGRGAFRLVGLVSGQYAVAAAHGHYAGAYRLDVDAPRRDPIQLRLGASGNVIQGTVSDEGGGPIGGARIIVRGWMLATFMAVSAPSGEYRLVLPDPAGELFATANGYGPAWVQLRREPNERRDLRLAPGARLSGRVTAAGRPVAGALVRLLPLAQGPRDRWEERAITSAEGLFSLADLPAAEFRLFVRQDRLVTPARGVVALRAGGEEKVELVLEPGVTVRGRISDSAGRPVRGSGVAVMETRSGLSQSALAVLAEVAADDRGSFALEGLPPGTIDVAPAAVGYHGQASKLELGERSVVEVDLRLEPMSGAVGTIFRSDGRPAANAQLRAHASPFEPGGAGRMSQARSDASGRFAIEGLGAGNVEIVAWLDGEAIAHGPFPLQVGERREVTVKLAPGAFVQGRVRWEDGGPAPGIRVTGRSERVNARPGQPILYQLMMDTAITDAEGAFTVGPFLPGRARLSAFTEGQRDVSTSAPRPNQAEAMVTAGQAVRGVEMVVSVRRQRIAGITLGPAGKPLPGATLIADRELSGQTPSHRSSFAERSVSGGDGAFAVEGLSEGTFTIFARHPDHPDVLAEGVRAGTTGLEVRFPRSAQLTGTIRTRSGRPVASASLVVLPAAPPGAPPPARLSEFPHLELVDPRGAFTVPRLLPGRYDLTATTAEGLVAQVLDVAIAAGETKRIRLVAEPGATLVGRVVDEAGQPAADAKVMVHLAGIRNATAPTDAAGAFTLRGALVGPKVQVRAFREHAPLSGRIEVEVPRLGATVDVGTIRLVPRTQAR